MASIHLRSIFFTISPMSSKYHSVLARFAKVSCGQPIDEVCTFGRKASFLMKIGDGSIWMSMTTLLKKKLSSCRQDDQRRCADRKAFFKTLCRINMPSDSVTPVTTLSSWQKCKLKLTHNYHDYRGGTWYDTNDCFISLQMTRAYR